MISCGWCSTVNCGRVLGQVIDLLETATWRVDSREDRATSVCAVPSDKLSYSQSRAVQEENVSGILPKTSSPTMYNAAKVRIYCSI